MARYIIGSDVGGTFTDICAIDLETGEQKIAKTLSTPPTFIEGLMNGLEKVQIPGKDVVMFRHGATISTNAILERRGAKIGLIVTEGFKGMYPGERSERPGAFELNWDPPDPLVPPRAILGVRERISTRGEIVTPLHEEDVRRAAKIFRKRGMEAIAVCYMDSYVNPIHEKRTKEILQEECPEMFITISYEVLPRMLEFERTSTTVLNAYIGPVLNRYMTSLRDRLSAWGYNGDLLITHSGGGVMTVDEALKLPVKTCHSSPVSGVVGFANYIGQLTGNSNLIAFETGGTTNDVSMVFQGNPTSTNEWRILWNTPCCLPSIETTYIGAGGGSIAWVDSGGGLRLGPHSAGATPGPACFGLGGEEPTSTDCQLVLGRLNPDYFLGGAVPLYPDKAREAIKEKVADKYGWTVEDAASSILKIAISNLMIALRLQSVARGWDPSDFALVAYGGGGALYGAELSKELGANSCIVPPLPGYASAIGSTRVPMVHDLIMPFNKTESELRLGELNKQLKDLVDVGRSILRKGGISEEMMVFNAIANMKYFDQFRPIPVEIGFEKIDSFEELKKRFHDAMNSNYGYDLPPGFPVEIEVSDLRVQAIGKTKTVEFKKLDGGKLDPKKAVKERRKVYFSEKDNFVEASIYERGYLASGDVLEGPAVIEQPDSTTVLPPGFRCSVDEYGNLIIKQIK
jgi:N-methylhydantoinase A